MPTLRKALIYFDQAIRDGSIRKAAESLHVASSAISRQLLQIEYELDVELFFRLPHGIRPTAAGERLLDFIRQTNRDEIRLKQDIARLKGGVRGTIRIAAAESIMEETLPAAMRAYRESFPLVDFSLMSGDNYRIKKELQAKKADIICAFDVIESAGSELLAAIEVELGVIVPPDHPLTGLTKIGLSDCSKYPVITPTPDWLAHSNIRELFEDRKLPMRIGSRVESISSLKNLVAAGMGIAFLSRVGMRGEIESGKLVWLPLSGARSRPLVISLLVERGRVQPPYVSAFVAILRDELLKLRG